MCRESFSPTFVQVCPRVGGLVHSVAVGDVAAQAGFAGARIKDVVVRVGNRDGADRGNALLIEGRRPGHAAVGALEDAAGNRAEVIRVGIAGHAGDSEDAPAAKGSDLAPLHAPDEAWVNLCRRVRRQ